MMDERTQKGFDILQKQIETLERRLSEFEGTRSRDYFPRSVKQRHVEAWIIFSGLEADLPDGTTQVKAYFATDTNTLYLWNGTAWVGAVFT